MTNLDDIMRLAGAWTGHSSLWFQPNTPAHESDSTATVTTIASGKLVSLSYTWTHEGDPQDGQILLSIDDTEGVHMAWCDSFHMDTKLMALTGRPEDDAVAANGSYQFPGSEPWGWRIEIEPRGSDAFQLRMFNVLPASMGGASALAVQANYTRA